MLMYEKAMQLTPENFKLLIGAEKVEFRIEVHLWL
ncbi:hypothetical protein BHN427_05796 [Streptococcus pneumoniae BHN427]|nr:hypothetical protein HMPREF0837_11372 [Streptococcus pneumoniae TCH8431/19A]AGZ47812.1 hypothetical protein T308_05380 [Streptococcus pneumoniae A026]EDK62821.1 hypothetical protein CGSSp11BS70_04463 [Streptococcus pneumoniae SP11-BS70]EDK70124.1 hypothetical protein CGSSp19BS75_02168 [Streptococcus pneumoniae SP19-BS75]EDK73897.1 hypothetical protein CGSSp3BS71_00645 [Streptococcus pneumoniae SP3-BS71]EDK76454.1 hypothetical protein CGSSp6BS73_04460 [Streptococcus pneumoniae SP6-BS73]EDK7